MLEQLALGSSYHEIGLALYITENTVKTHLASLYRKLGVERSRQRSGWPASSACSDYRVRSAQPSWPEAGALPGCAGWRRTVEPSAPMNTALKASWRQASARAV